MTAQGQCPSCGAAQALSLLCSSCCDRLERDLGDVASIVGELDITMSRQDKIPSSSGGGTPSPKRKEEDAGLSAIAHTRTPINFGAVQAADNLANVLTTWARDVAGAGYGGVPPGSAARAASYLLLLEIDAIRRHTEVAKMVEQIHHAIAEARRVVDRPFDRIYLGQCMVETTVPGGEDVTCYEDVYAMPDAFETRCKVCGITHVVADRRKWLMTQAQDRLFTVREAAQMVGNVGGRQITEDRIRGYLRRKRIVFHTANLIRLGDLLAVVVTDSEKRTA